MSPHDLRHVRYRPSVRYGFGSTQVPGAECEHSLWRKSYGTIVVSEPRETTSDLTAGIVWLLTGLGLLLLGFGLFWIDGSTVENCLMTFGGGFCLRLGVYFLWR